MSQSRRVQNARRRDVLAFVGVIRQRMAALRPRQRAQSAAARGRAAARCLGVGKECRIFFPKCHVAKLWRVLSCFQEERLNPLPFHLSPSPPLCPGCTAAAAPRGGDKRQEIDGPACHVWSDFFFVISTFSRSCVRVELLFRSN